MNRLTLLVFAVFLISLSACKTTDSIDGDQLRIASSVSPITDLVKQIGPNAKVTGLVPEGVNSHTFEPTPSTARAIAEADIVFINGLNLEEPIKKLSKANLKDRGKLVEIGNQTLTEADYIYDFSFPKDEGDPNPHLWTNPPYALRFSEIIRDELVKADPKNRPLYESNQTKLAALINALDQAIRAASASIPSELRKLLTYHDSFPYFAREYGWTVVGAIQPSDFSEPSAAEVASLIAQIKTEKVPAIFGSEVFPSPVLEQIARESGARYVDDLRDDDLPDSDPTYIGLMKFDYITMVEALGGDASALKNLKTKI